MAHGVRKSLFSKIELNLVLAIALEVSNMGIFFFFSNFILKSEAFFFRGKGFAL